LKASRGLVRRRLEPRESRRHLEQPGEELPVGEPLGAAYEYLIKQFADSAGKKGGEFYTPRDVVRLMVLMLAPAEGMRVYDPCCGSGGMLILSRQYVEEHGGNPRDVSRSTARTTTAASGLSAR
jgi:16S rRNA C967 or C1407 C5-methylase (RsmB/RsmF family)